MGVHDETSIRVILFSGKKQDWSGWEERFLAKARRKGFKDILLGKVTIPKSTATIDLTTDAGKALQKIVDSNDMAYEQLILSMDITKSGGKVAFGIIKGSKSADYEDGNGTVAWTRLLNKYSPKTAPSLVKLERQFRTSKLKKGADPDDWITSLEELRGRLQEMGSEIKEDQFLIHVLNNLSKEYQLQVLLMEKRINAFADPLTIEDMRSDLNLQFERMNEHEDDDSKSTSEEKALAMIQFKGRCNHCGKYGHKGADCRNKTANKQDHKNGGAKNFGRDGKKGGFKGNCNFCNKYGHKAADCFKKKNSKKGGESANNATEGKADDVVLVCVESDLDYDSCAYSDEDSFDEELINCSNQWIGTHEPNPNLQPFVYFETPFQEQNLNDESGQGPSKKNDAAGKLSFRNCLFQTMKKTMKLLSQ